MHGDKKWVRVTRDYAYWRNGYRMWSQHQRGYRIVPTRWKRSRHKTMKDQRNYRDEGTLYYHAPAWFRAKLHRSARHHNKRVLAAGSEDFAPLNKWPHWD